MSKPFNYQAALDYIYSFVDYSLTRSLRYSPEKFDLSRMNHLLDLIGNPHRDFRIIHVAGTKGKGSICAMISSILTQSGYKTGFYSSPHMVEFTERIRIGNEFIKKNLLAEYINRLKPCIDQVKDITTFEITTALAFKFFSDQKVDFAVVEVGLGGRFDATNVVSPMVSVISNISFDHTKILGNTLSRIAFEKAGIIKKNIPVVVSRQKNAALQTIKAIASERNAELINAGESYKVVNTQKSLDMQSFEIIKDSKSSGTIELPLIGDHQLENAKTAFAVIEALRKQGVEISGKAVIEGFKHVDWPGRFEILEKEPLIIIDGAHNPESFRSLAKTVKEYLPDKKIFLVFGISEDKNLATMLKIIKPITKTLIITKSMHPRAMDPMIISDIAQSLGIQYIRTDSVESAAIKAESLTDKNSVIIAAGSIFIAGAFREILLAND